MPRFLGTTFITLALVTLAGSPPAAQAYPIPPNPLWPLTAEAELIVVAQVAAVEELKVDEDDWYTAAARLDITETWKGTEHQQVAVPYAPNLICPAPARYAEGETVVAFLRWDAERSAWSTISLSYGTLYPQGEELQDFKSMVEQAVALQSSEFPPKQLKHAKRDWLVRAAALPGTRWHGLSGLEPEGDFYPSAKENPHQQLRHVLQEHHFSTLSEAFRAHPKADYTSTMMLSVLRNHPDPRLDDLTIGMVEAGLAMEETPDWLFKFIVEVLFRQGDPRPLTRFEAVNQEMWEISRHQLRRLWTNAKLELSIDQVAPVELEHPRSLPVGEQTPD